MNSCMNFGEFQTANKTYTKLQNYTNMAVGECGNHIVYVVVVIVVVLLLLLLMFDVFVSTIAHPPFLTSGLSKYT